MASNSVSVSKGISNNLLKVSILHQHIKVKNGILTLFFYRHLQREDEARHRLKKTNRMKI